MRRPKHSMGVMMALGEGRRISELRGGAKRCSSSVTKQPSLNNFTGA